jgi:uncharacterized protein YjbI with pentapeptide repeats
MSEHEDNNRDEHYDGEYNGKPIVYAENVPSLLRQKPHLTEEDRELLKKYDLPSELEHIKTTLNQMTHLSRARYGPNVWNLWVRLFKKRWLVYEEKETQVAVDFPNRLNFLGEAPEIIDFSVGTDLNDSRYLIDLYSFANFLFPCAVVFDNAQFDVGVYFDHAFFCGEVSFRKVTFSAEASFWKADFLDEVDFRHAKFIGETDFKLTIFKDNVDFSASNFGNVCSFNVAKFEGQAKFRLCRFHGQLTFHDSVFEVHASFVGCKLIGGVSFVRVQFKTHAHFTNAIIDQPADFSDVKFHGSMMCAALVAENMISFTDVCFYGETKFHSSKFKCGLIFSGATFHSSVSFGNVLSLGSMVFVSVKFLAHASFNGSVLINSVSFNDTDFSSFVDFRGIQLLSRSRFRGARFNAYTDFDGAFFGKVTGMPAPHGYTTWTDEEKVAYDTAADDAAVDIVPDFLGAVFLLAPNLSYMHIAQRSMHNGIASKFRRLQELAAQGHNHHAEAKFFRAELLSRRGHEVTSKLRITAINCYELFSNCGLSFWRPIGWWTLVFVLFALLAYLPFTRVPVFDDTANIGHLFNYTLSNALPFIGVFKGNDTVAVEALYGGAAGIPFWNSFLAGTHNLISSILLFLALLAVRNYFKMR